MNMIEKNCVFEHQGHKFESGGAVVNPDYAVGYFKTATDDNQITDWHGNKLGNARITARWNTPQSFVSSHMFQVEAIIDGTRYSGRTAGDGMIWKGKRKA